MWNLIYVAGALAESWKTKRGLTPSVQAISNPVARFVAQAWQDKLGWGVKTALGVVLMLLEQGFDLPYLLELAGILQVLWVLGQQFGWWQKIQNLMR